MLEKEFTYIKGNVFLKNIKDVFLGGVFVRLTSCDKKWISTPGFIELQSTKGCVIAFWVKAYCSAVIDISLPHSKIKL